ncbi:MAG: sigma-70 family RNA polymerase sigma factor [Acidobacteria bacterium]|nr:sigma-70 family RNA polymerase sigma factor [Acidobacteriota bacterium]
MEHGELTQLLQQWSRGDGEALNALMPLVYHELKQIAGARMRNERSGHTLQPTALIHEAYVRLVRQQLPDFRNRAHFFGVAAQVMRQVLVDEARKHRAGKRGNGRSLLSLEALPRNARVPPSVDLLDLDSALNKMQRLDEPLSRLVEMHYFGGMTAEEMAELLGVSVRTIGRDLRTAKTWLCRELEHQPRGVPGE